MLGEFSQVVVLVCGAITGVELMRLVWPTVPAGAVAVAGPVAVRLMLMALVTVQLVSSLQDVVARLNHVTDQLAAISTMLP